jgi:hypothetical protein
LLCAGCALRSPPGPWPVDWTGWTEPTGDPAISAPGSAPCTEREPRGEEASEEHWPEAPAAEDAANDEAASAALTREQEQSEPAAPTTPSPEPSFLPPAAEQLAATVESGSYEDTGAAPASQAQDFIGPVAVEADLVGAASAAALAPVPLSDQQLLDVEVFALDDAPIGKLVDLIVDPRGGDVLGAVLLRDSGEREFLSSELTSGGDKLVVGASGTAAPNLAELFAAEDPEVIEGELISSQREVLSTEGSALLKVRDAENLLHRIRVSAPDLVQYRLPALQTHVSVRAKAVATRDPEGKVLIASALTVGDQTVELRDGTGKLLWEQLAAPMLGVRSLIGISVEHEALSYTIAGFVFAPAERRITHIVLTREGQRQEVPFEALGLTGVPR